MIEPEMIETVLREARPLEHPRGDRLPLYIWGLRGTPPGDDDAVRGLLQDLDARGIGLIAVWEMGDGRERSLRDGLRIARLQRELGLAVSVDAIQPLYHFFNGDPHTMHIDDDANTFFDSSFDQRVEMGCPFTLEARYPVIRGQVESFAEAYHRAGLPVDFIFSDWEIDGPLEWNGAWDASRRCRRCREHIRDIDDFAMFQRTLRGIRADMQRACYAEPILQRFPDCLVGNYAVYPHNGWRYWYDYFEVYNPELPHRWDQREPYRPWANEFEGTGYTFGMPVLYTWYRTFDWYDFDNTDYRWFYNMLKVASNAAEHTPPETPLITFVHHNVTSPPAEGSAPHVVPMSEWAYEELLWHVLLRGHATLFSWSPADETAHEVRLLHRVWAAALAYREFLDGGTPVTFEVPAAGGAVISGLRLGERVLVRRTDFGSADEVISLQVGEDRLSVPRAPKRCQVLTLSR